MRNAPRFMVKLNMFAGMDEITWIAFGKRALWPDLIGAEDLQSRPRYRINARRSISDRTKAGKPFPRHANVCAVP